MIEKLKDLANEDLHLIHRGRFVNTIFLLQAGGDQWLVEILAGRIANLTKGPFVMPRWTFALRASAEAWEIFWSANPPPGFHDLFALIKFKRLTVEGDMHSFMANLFYFKALLTKLRRTV